MQAMEPAAQNPPPALPPLPNPVVSDIATPTPQPRVASPVGRASSAGATVAPVNGHPPASSAPAPSTILPHPARPAPPSSSLNAAAQTPGLRAPEPYSHPASSTPRQLASQPSRWAATPAERSSYLPQPSSDRTPQSGAFVPSGAQPAKPAQATRYVIMDPPSRLSVAPMSRQAGRGYASPTTDYARENPKFLDDSGRLTCAIQQSLPEAVRRVVRDNWEKCLLGSEFHQAFTLNAALHHAVPNTTRRAVRDFGAKLVTESKFQIVKHFSARDLDDVSEEILSIASDDFLDKCLEKRLLTIEAKPLIQALARAERLGYEQGDIVEDDGHERVIPNNGTGQAAAGDRTYSQQQPLQSSSQQPKPQASYSSSGRLQCLKCYRVFAQPTAYEYHTQKDVCSRTPPSAEGFRFACQHCGQGFANSGGLQYHNMNKVCGDFGDNTPPTRGPGRPPRDRVSSGSAASLAQPSPRTLPHATSPAVLAKHAAAASDAAARSSPNTADPYAHLTPQQLDAMQEELHDAELKYTAKFQDAELIPDPEERRAKLDGLRNSFGTKQSMIRKKYGVRLRERRTKTEIQAERDRMGLGPKGQATPTPSTVPARRSLDTSNRTPTPVRASSGWTAANGPAATASASASAPEAANGDQQNNKRRRLDEGESGVASSSQRPRTPTTSEPPAKRLAVADIAGGLGESPATVAHRDPTLPHSSSAQTQSSARAEGNPPGNSSLAPGRRPSNPQSHSTYATPASRASSTGATEAKAIAVDEESSDDDDDADIPAKLPAHVRHSLTPKTGT